MDCEILLTELTGSNVQGRSPGLLVFLLEFDPQNLAI